MLQKIFSSIVGGGIVSAAEGVANIIDKFVETDEERAVAERLKIAMAMKPAELQVELNKIEAGHRSVFVAGWRPFCGWVYAGALLYSFVLRDILAWVMVNTGSEASMPPELAMEHLLVVLLGMLGLGTARTFEKLRGKAK